MKCLHRLDILLAVILVLILAMGLALGCGDDDDDDDDNDAADDDSGDDDDGDDDDDDNDDDTPPAPNAQLRTLHLGPNAGVVDVYLDASFEFVHGLDFTQGTTYAEIPAGDYALDIVPSDGDPATDGLLDAPLTLEPGVAYTAVFYGEILADKEGSGLAAWLIVDDPGVAEDAANFILHLGHAADADTLEGMDVWSILGAPEDDTLLVDDFAYGGGEYLELAPGGYRIGIDLDEDNTAYDLTFTTPDFVGGAQYNLFAVFSNPDTFLIAQLPDGDTTRIDPDVK